MAQYIITAPNGEKFKVNAPDGATQEQVMAFAQQQFAAKQGQQPQTPKAIDPSEGELPFRPFGMDTGLNMPQGVSRFMAGAGKAFTDVGRGVGQLVNAVSREDIDRAKELDAPLMRTGAGVAGNIAGNVAATAPLAMVPGAATVGGGAALGALTGAIQPVGTEDSRLFNTVVGTVAGAAVPLAVKGFNTVKAAVVDPFTEAGKTRIAGGVLNRAAGDKQAAYRAMQTAQGATPGFNPTVGQATQDAGLASLERTVRAVDPKRFGGVDAAQRQALADAVRGIAKDPTARQVAVDAREAAVKPLYDAAKQAVVDGDPALEAILKRPTVAAGLSQAEKIAADEGRKFAMQAGSKPTTIATVNAEGVPILQDVAAAPSKYSGQGLHDVKMGIDAAIQEASPGIGNRISQSQMSAKNAYLSWLEDKIPAYGQAKETFAQMSQPINQMDIGNEFADRLIPSLYRDMPAPQQLNAQAYARALMDQGDDIARNVTGMNGTTLRGTMSPQQMGTLHSVAKDLQSMKIGENAGRGPGSDTVQKIAMSHIAAEAGIPNWLASVGRVPGGWVKRAGDVLYGNADDQVRMKLAELLANPAEAAGAMQTAGINPSQVAGYLKALGQAPALAVPAAVNARQQ